MFSWLWLWWDGASGGTPPITQVRCAIVTMAAARQATTALSVTRSATVAAIPARTATTEATTC